MYCFVRKYAAIPEQVEMFIIQYIDWCVIIVIVIDALLLDFVSCLISD